MISIINRVKLVFTFVALCIPIDCDIMTLGQLDETSVQGVTPQVIPVEADQQLSLRLKSEETQRLSPKEELTVSQAAPSLRILKAENMVEAWDWVGSVTSEIATSVMSIQANVIATRFKRKKPREGPPKKRSRGHASLPKDECLRENWSQALSRRMDRMSRMSIILMQVEYYHRQLRSEIVELKNEMQAELDKCA